MASVCLPLRCLLLALAACYASGYSSDTPKGDEPSDLQRLVKYLQSRNPDKTRPVRHNEQNVTVTISIAPKRTLLDDHKQEMTVDAWTFLTWNDSFLRWSPSDYGGVDRVHLDDTELWLPDVTVYNRVLDASTSIFGTVPVLVLSSGAVLWFPPTHVTVGCPLVLLRWPSDRHNCSLDFGSWTHHGEQIDLQIVNGNAGVMMENYVESNGWRLLNSSAERRHVSQDGSLHVDIHFTFLLQRLAANHAGYITTSTLVVLVCVVSSYVVPVSQLLARLLLHVFSLAVLIACYCLLFFALPSTDGPVPYVFESYKSCLVLCVLSLLCCLWLYTLGRRTAPSFSLISAIKQNARKVQRYRQLDEEGGALAQESGVPAQEGGAPAQESEALTQEGGALAQDCAVRASRRSAQATMVNIADSVGSPPPHAAAHAPLRATANTHCYRAAGAVNDGNIIATGNENELLSINATAHNISAGDHRKHVSAANPPSNNTSSDLNQIKAQRIENERKIRIKVFNYIAAGLFALAFLINYIVLRQYIN